ncbi:Signal recognition particle 54 kDa protein, chloroplastic [Hordeum vulgare]|nr:Signal recognition particle 54 kDa protein, chloroplastic [Hordeum vulgare]
MELTLAFFEEEVGRAITSMKVGSTPGPVGLHVVFFQKFRNVIKPVIMPMFHEFYIGTFDMAQINYGMIVLIPKIVAATDIRHFRPITVINVLERIFPKVCVTWLALVAERLDHPL